MREASESFVDLPELHRAVGEAIARLTRNEGAMVTSGVAAGLYLACAGLLRVDDPPAFGRLPQSAPLGRSVIVHSAHHVPFMCAIQQFGAELRVVGKDDSRADNHASEIEDAITSGHKPLAVVYVAAGPGIAARAPSFAAYARVCSKHGVPLIVDAAARLPPADNLWLFTHGGASIALFSGGKDLRGPSSAGLMLGRKGIVDACRAIASPNHGIGRVFKVDKEELVGMYVAVREYLKMDHAKRTQWCEDQIRKVTGALERVPGVTATRSFPNEAGQNIPRARIEYDTRRHAYSVEDLVSEFEQGNPSVAFLAGEQGAKPAIYFNPMTLKDGETEVVISRLMEVFH